MWKKSECHISEGSQHGFFSIQPICNVAPDMACQRRGVLKVTWQNFQGLFQAFWGFLLCFNRRYYKHLIVSEDIDSEHHVRYHVEECDVFTNIIWNSVTYLGMLCVTWENFLLYFTKCLLRHLFVSKDVNWDICASIVVFCHLKFNYCFQRR